MKVKIVKYGRTIEVGRFGFGRKSGRVWFGWEVEIDEDAGETEEQAMMKMKDLADKQEKVENVEFNKANGYG